MNTILFDLDGTFPSHPYDFYFEKLYFEELSKNFADIISPSELAKNIWSSTKIITGNTEYKTNEEIFMSDFTTRNRYGNSCSTRTFRSFLRYQFFKN